MSIEYRLTWECLSPLVAANLADQYGKDYWKKPGIRDGYSTQSNSWHKTSVVFHGEERMDQYRTLKNWEETGSQPVRNVVLEKREAPDPKDGWTLA